MRHHRPERGGERWVCKVVALVLNQLFIGYRKAAVVVVVVASDRETVRVVRKSGGGTKIRKKK